MLSAGIVIYIGVYVTLSPSELHHCPSLYYFPALVVTNDQVNNSKSYKSVIF